MIEKEVDNLDSPYTAEHARKKAYSLSGEKNSKILIDVLSKIQAKANNGEFRVTVFSLPDPVGDELKKRGFKVNFYQCDHHDPRESDYHDITW